MQSRPKQALACRARPISKAALVDGAILFQGICNEAVESIMGRASSINQDSHFSCAAEQLLEFFRQMWCRTLRFSRALPRPWATWTATAQRRVILGVGCSACCTASVFTSTASAESAPCTTKRLASHLTEGLPPVRFLNDLQIERMVTLINAIIDLPSFSDEEEQRILKHAACAVASAIERTLPRTFLLLVRHAEPNEGLDIGQADELRKRLSHKVRTAVELPYLPLKQEWQLIQCIVSLTVAAMQRDSSFDRVLDVDVAGPILMECFIKGNAGAFFNERAAVVDTLADDLAIPLIPASWKHKLCSRVVDELALLLEKAMLTVYEASRQTVDAAAAAALSADRAAAEAALREEEAALSTPFDMRVRTALAELVKSRLPKVASTPSVQALIGHAVDLALDSALDAAEMNAAATYMLDQHRLSLRLRNAPPAARDLLLRKKEQILGAVLSMDSDGDGAIDLPEEAEIAELFVAIDADGSGEIQPEEVEVLLFGRPLEPSRRAQILAACNRTRKHEGHSSSSSTLFNRGGAGEGVRGLLRLLPLYVMGRLLEQGGSSAESRAR